MSVMFCAVHALIGAVAGVILFWAPVLRAPPAIPFLVLLVAAVALLLARKNFDSRPVLATGILNLWELAASAMVALSTQTMLWLALVVAPILGAPDAESAKVGASFVVAAVTTFIGVLLTKDIENGDGFFFASTQFRNCLAPQFASKYQLESASIESEVCNLNVVSSRGIKGWSIVARQKRARILSNYLKSKKEKIT